MPRGRRTRRPPNIVLLGFDALRADHLSCYGYHRLTSPHIDRFAAEGTLFERYYSPHIPTTSGYASMLTGMDVFSTQMVALRHKGPLRPEIKTLAEILREEGYTTTSVGFKTKPSGRGFDSYLEFEGWDAAGSERMPKAENLNAVTIPELHRLSKQKQPFLLFARHIDPHTPYLPPAPYERLFYHGNECDPKNKSMEPLRAFKPFRDYLLSWMPEGVTDKDYVIAQYDGAIAYMDACIKTIFTALASLNILDESIVVVTSDHGETLYDHDCYFDHHGLYDCTLRVPLIIRYPGKVPAGRRISGYGSHYDLVPTLLELAGLRAEGSTFDGKSLLPVVRGEASSHRSEYYITECTWMRKHGWRTPQWKLIEALEPDFHFKPPVELYNLAEDPDEYHNLAESEPDVVASLKRRMEDWIWRREQETGLPNPIYHQVDFYPRPGIGPFATSQEAFDTLYIGPVRRPKRPQAGDSRS